jgi:hypothetical protein
MFKNNRFLLVFNTLVVLAAALILTGCSSTAKAPVPQGNPAAAASSDDEITDAPVQSSSGGLVTLEAKLLGHEGESLVFEIVMDTHSVALDGYDLKELAVLRDNKGGDFSPVEWISAPGGHHRKGKLAFSHPDRTAETFELVIRDVAGVSERVLKWQV